MSSSTKHVAPASSALVKAYQDMIGAQLREAKARLDVIEAIARQKKAQAEIAAIANLNAARHRIEARSKDLKTTHESNVSRAKAEIQADVSNLKGSIEEIAARFKIGGPKL
jgi:hypothetical protein